MREPDKSKIIASLIIIGYFILIATWAVLSLVFRFQNPELTETQLMIEYFRRFWKLDIAVVIYTAFIFWTIVKY